MATRGRKPKPTAAKKRAGNPGRRKLNEDEPQYRIKAPPCPKFLDKEARKEWRRVCKLLVRSGVLTDVDRAILIAYCRAWSLYVEADKAVQQYGSMLISKRVEKVDPNTGEKTVTGGTPYQSPYVNQMTAAMKSMVAYAAELGMTPSSRTRVSAAPPAGGKPAGVAGMLKIVG